jgi:uncharacterized membrane protein YkgB
MIKDFNVSEKGHGSYRLLGILRWVMVLIFISFGIQKFTAQSADGIALYISNSPFVSWLSIFGIRGEANLLGIIELTTAALLAAGAFIPILSALGSLMGIGTFAITWSFFFSTPGVVKWSISRVEPHRGILVQRRRFSLCLYRVVSGVTAKESRPASFELTSRHSCPTSALCQKRTFSPYSITRLREGWAAWSAQVSCNFRRSRFSR